MTIAIIDGDVLLYMSIWNSETLEEGKSKFKDLLDGVLNSLFTTNYVMAIGGPDNFRVDLFPDYKANRKKAKDNRPDWFGNLKTWAAQLEGCEETNNCEADDLVRIWSLECDNAGINRVVVSVDKDLDCIPGTHYNPRTKQIYQITEKYANRFYWQQILTGDSVDNIPGLRRVGPKKAEKLLADAGTHEELRNAVCKAYHNAHGDEGYSYLLANGRLIHIWRKFNDHFRIKREVYEAAIKE
jgi:5'-3' exonuclease